MSSQHSRLKSLCPAPQFTTNNIVITLLVPLKVCAQTSFLSFANSFFLTNVLQTLDGYWLPDEERHLMHSKRHRTRKVGNFFHMKKQSCHETTSQYRYLLPFAAELEQLGHMARPGPPANPGIVSRWVLSSGDRSIKNTTGCGRRNGQKPSAAGKIRTPPNQPNQLPHLLFPSIHI